MSFTATLADGEGGIAIRQSEASWLSFGVTAGRTIVRKNGELLYEGPPGRRFTLRADDQKYELWLDGSKVLDVDGRFLSAQSVRGFLGVWIGVYTDTGGRFERVTYES